MTDDAKQRLRARILDKTLEVVAKDAHVSVLTIAKVLADLPVNESGAQMVERYAARLR